MVAMRSPIARRKRMRLSARRLPEISRLMSPKCHAKSARRRREPSAMPPLPS